MSLSHESLTSKILESAFEVSNELGSGFLEAVYEGDLFIAMTDKGLKVERQAPIQVRFRDQVVGTYYADLLVEGLVVLELKAVKALVPEHIAQVLNYLRATGMPVALLLNFGTAKMEWRRFDNQFVQKTMNRDEGDEGDMNQTESGC